MKKNRYTEKNLAANLTVKMAKMGLGKKNGGKK